MRTLIRCCMVLGALALALTTLAVPAPPTVAIVKGKDIEASVAKAIALSGGLRDLVKDGQTVVIKPNLVEFRRKECPGMITDPKVVRAIIMEIKKVADCKIIIAEGSAQDTMKVYMADGYDKVAQETGATLLDFNRDLRVTVKGEGYVFDYPMPKTLMEADVFIDVPVMKTHLMVGTTLGMKNLFGLMPKPKDEFHDNIEQVLCDLVKIRKPDLTVIDGIIATEGQGPLEGTPLPMDLIIAGRNVVATDAVTSACMTYDTAEIRYLKLANEQGLGEIDVKKINVVGETIDAVKHPFRYAYADVELTYPKSQAAVDRLLAVAINVWPQDGYMCYEIPPSAFKPDTAKFPKRVACNMVVSVPDFGDTMLFAARYEAAIWSNKPAALDDAKRWIRKNIGPIK